MLSQHQVLLFFLATVTLARTNSSSGALPNGARKAEFSLEHQTKKCWTISQALLVRNTFPAVNRKANEKTLECSRHFDFWRAAANLCTQKAARVACTQKDLWRWIALAV
jgi:hypothetical protein